MENTRLPIFTSDCWLTCASPCWWRIVVVPPSHATCVWNCIVCIGGITEAEAVFSSRCCTQPCDHVTRFATTRCYAAGNRSANSTRKPYGNVHATSVGGFGGAVPVANCLICLLNSVAIICSCLRTSSSLMRAACQSRNANIAGKDICKKDGTTAPRRSESRVHSAQPILEHQAIHFSPLLSSSPFPAFCFPKIQGGFPSEYSAHATPQGVLPRNAPSCYLCCSQHKS